MCEEHSPRSLTEIAVGLHAFYMTSSLSHNIHASIYSNPKQLKIKNILRQ